MYDVDPFQCVAAGIAIAATIKYPQKSIPIFWAILIGNFLAKVIFQ